MYARTEPRRSPCALALAGLLAAGALALVMLTAPAAAQAAPIGADSTRILSGGADMLSDLPIPAGRSGATGEALSDDGSVAVFSSESKGLLAGDDDSVANIYAKNLATGAVTLVSRQTGATGEPSHTNCYSPVVSGNGRYVAFVCEGSLDPADDNGRSDVYRRDLTGGTTILVSRSVDGDPGDGYSDEPSINHDGDKIAFYSRASNLVPTPTVIRGGQIYVRAVNANTTTLVSRRSGAGPAGTDDSANPSIDDAGTRVAFDSRDDSFHPTDNNGTRDVFVHDLRDGETTLVSRSDGDGAIGTHESFDPAISGDGTSIAFVSSSRFDPMADPDHDHDVYRRSLGFKTTALVSVLASGEAGNGFSAAPSISANGDRVAFVSSATNLDDLDTEESPDVYVKDLQTNTMTLMSRESFDGGAVNLDAQSTSLDRDGKRALFSTGHGSVASGTEPGFSTVMLRDTTVTPPNTIVVARPPGTEPFVNEGSRAEGGSISADGRYVAFASSARALGVPAGIEAIVVRDTHTGEVRIASRENGLDGPVMAGVASEPVISADGRRVAFEHRPQPFEEALLPADTRRIYVRDLVAGTTVLASVATNGDSANAHSYMPTLNSDGSRVGFVSEATNLGDGDGDATPDVHVRDLETGRTSRATGAGGSKGNGESVGPQMSADGSKLAFVSSSTNLDPLDPNDMRDIYLRDLAAETTELVSRDGTGRLSGKSGHPSISADGNRIAFASSVEVPGVPSGTLKVFVRDLKSDRLVLASRADGPAGSLPQGSAALPRISGDGNSVAFAADFDAGPSEDLVVYWRDLARNRTRVASPEGTTHSARPTGITDNGECTTFLRAGEVLPGVRPEGVQLYMRSFGAGCEPTTTEPVDRVAPRLTEVRLKPARFRVRGKRRGSTLHFRLSEAARLTVRIQRRVAGRRKGGKCRPARRSKGKRCFVFRPVGTIVRDASAGPGKLRLGPRVRGRLLPRGRYGIVVAATDEAGNRSPSVTRRARVIR